MRKKLVFGALVLLALVLTTGTFAYTYTNYGTAQLDASFVDSAFNTVTPAASGQPAWNNVLPIVYFAPQYIYPNSPGALTENDQYPATGNNWDKVDDPRLSPDDSATYVYTASKFTKTDLYALEDVAPSINDIAGIKVHYRVLGNGTTGQVYADIEVNGTIYSGTLEAAPAGTWVDLTYEWVNNPDTGLAWTETDVNSLQAGVSITKPSGGGDVECTQVYVEVEYQLTITSGEVPHGALFEITPATGFLGDMTATVYITNTEALVKAYKYLNMEVQVTDSVEAGLVPDYQLLSLNNGAATFTIEGGAAAGGVYYVNITGGGYAVTSDNVSNWQSGWSVTPEFYCEVSQR